MADFFNDLNSGLYDVSGGRLDLGGREAKKREDTKRASNPEYAAAQAAMEDAQNRENFLTQGRANGSGETYDPNRRYADQTLPGYSTPQIQAPVGQIQWGQGMGGIAQTDEEYAAYAAQVARNNLEQEAAREQAAGQFGPASQKLAAAKAQERVKTESGKESAAELLARKQFSKATAMQKSAAASNRGANAAVGQRIAQQGITALGQAAGDESALIAAQEEDVNKRRQLEYEQFYSGQAATAAGLANQAHSFSLEEQRMKTAIDQYQQQLKMQQEQRWWDIAGSILQVGGGLLGGAIGGPGGAAVGSAVGDGLGDTLGGKPGSYKPSAANAKKLNEQRRKASQTGDSESGFSY